MLRLHDRPAGQRHQVDGLTLSLPFLSNLPADVEVVTEPRLAFTVNGTRFDSGSQVRPFASRHPGELTLACAQLDLKPWLGYLPASLPLRLRQARLPTDLRLRFALPAEGRPIDINGQINPMARPLALDIRAKATDLELAPLSTYAGKYAGYAITRGKLSMDVAYKIDADGHLAASNQVVLNPLSFGARVESPSATRLPVLLAAALPTDRNGVIDINLPVSGSVSDPQFSLGGLIWKVILNLLGKAFSSPFALLAGNDSDDLSTVEFCPGSAQIVDSGQQALDKVAALLLARPGLKLTVTGAADPATERTALRLAALPASDDTARDLALQRGLAVRDALVARKLPSERWVLAAPQLHVAADAGTVWTPQVSLSLSTR